jgi:ABC-type Fe3+-hydroxamate transport system substrate-binding protein
MSWGEIYKIAFADIASRAREARRISPEYFIVTNEQIILLNQDNNEAAIKKLAVLEKAPAFEKRDVYGITDGNFAFREGPWETTIQLKDDLCVYESNHESSGHFKKLVWKKGVGLIEYAAGYGAAADGFRLKRVKTG